MGPVPVDHQSRLFATNEPARAMWDKFGPSFDETFKEEVGAIRSESFVPR